MERTLQVLNELEAEGVLRRYAIGGAMGAMFHTEPVLTFDLDVFVELPAAAGGILTLGAIYDALRERGHAEQGEHVEIEGVPVQFLPAYSRLIEEALTEARETTYESTTTRVFRVEHLIAIAVDTGRAKDRERVRLLVEQGNPDRVYLAEVLARHGLDSRFREWTTA